jgi:hypothetical protein
MFSYKKHGKYPIASDGDKKVYLNENKMTIDSSFKTSGKFELYPRDDGERICGYITGSSGAGKTTWIANYCKKYHKIYPKAPIYLFSEKQEDPNIDKLQYIKRIIIDDDILEIAEIPLENYLENTLLIFDDYIDLPKSYLIPIMSLIRRVLKLGRQYKISCLVVSHIINPTTNREFTREILLESHFVVWFNQDNTRGINYYLKTYAGLDTKKIQDIQNTNGRVIIHSNRYPQYIITEKEIFKI